MANIGNTKFLFLINHVFGFHFNFMVKQDKTHSYIIIIILKTLFFVFSF